MDATDLVQGPAPAAPATLSPRTVAMVGLVVFALALVALHHVLAGFSLAAIAAEISALGVRQLLLALAGAACSYALLTAFDWLGVRLVGGHVPLPALAVTAFIANAFGHNLGMAALTGGAVRARGYAAWGLDVVQVGHVVASASLGFGLGALAWLGLALCFESSQAAQALRLPAPVLQPVGAILLLVLAGVLVSTARGARQIALRGHRVALPGLSDTALMLVISVLELSCAALVLYALLPAEAGIGFLGFTGLYLVAISAGLISTVPAGLGVFEATLIVLLPQVPAHALLGAIIVYRAIYYLLPLLLALLLLGGRETLARVPAIRSAAAQVRRFGEPMVAPAIALAVFAAGASLVLSGSVPVGASRMGMLSDKVPLALLEMSHLGASAIGVALLLLARGIYLRLDAAWALAVVGLVAAIVALLLSGFRWELALLLAGVLLPLQLARARFDRPSPLGAGLLSWSSLRNIVLVMAASIWLGLFVNRHVEYGNELWWEFAFGSDAPRMLRASLLAVVLVAGTALWGLLRPAAAPPAVSTAAERQRALPLIAGAARCDAQLALLPDKQLLFDDAGTGFVMFQRSGPCLVAMGDPVGAPAVQAALAWRLRELADRQGLWPVFYQVGAEQLPTYLDMGLSLTKLGEEAVVPLAAFSLEGSARAELRQAHRRAVREGAVFAVVPQVEVAGLLPRLRVVSDDWLVRKDAAEKEFSLGWFDDNYLAAFDCAVVRVRDEIVAFANLWRGQAGGEVSIDLMRYTHDAPRGSMDFLFVELMMWAKAQGYRDFVLGMAPLSGLSHHQLAPAWHKLGGFVWRHGESFYNFEGLRKYKEKFLPVWRPRYLASPGGLRLPRVLLEVSRLIAGGTGALLHP